MNFLTLDFKDLQCEILLTRTQSPAQLYYLNSNQNKVFRALLKSPYLSSLIKMINFPRYVVTYLKKCGLFCRYMIDLYYFATTILIIYSCLNITHSPTWPRIFNLTMLFLAVSIPK